MITKKRILIIAIFFSLIFSCTIENKSNEVKEYDGKLSEFSVTGNEVALDQSRGLSGNFVTNSGFNEDLNGWYPLYDSKALVNDLKGNKVLSLKPALFKNKVGIFKNIYNSKGSVTPAILTLFSKGTFYTEVQGVEVTYRVYITTHSNNVIDITSGIKEIQTNYINKISAPIEINLPADTKSVYWAIQCDFDYVNIDNEVIIDDASLYISTPDNDYIYSKGEKLYKNGEEIELKSVSFTNYYFKAGKPEYNYDFLSPDHAHHSSADWVNVKSMGFNTVRFAFSGNHWLKYKDAVKEEDKKFWIWLDKNVTEAANNGVYLVLDMHVPVGYHWLDQDEPQNPEKNIWLDSTYREQFIECWRQIATKYKDNKTIAAYQILNEPVTSGLVEQWTAPDGLAQKTVDAIREIDKEHLIIVDLPNGEFNEYDFTPEEMFFTVDDYNVMYNFHYYYPEQFSHQGATWTDQGHLVMNKYPDEEKVLPVGDITWTGYTDFKDYAKSVDSSEWKKYESKLFKVTNSKMKFGAPELKAEGYIGAVLFDDLTIKEYDQNGIFVRDVAIELFTDGTVNYWYNYSLSNNPSECFYKVRDESDKDHKLALAIDSLGDPKVDGAWGCEEYYFLPKLNYQYKIIGYMKEVKPGTGKAGFVISFYDGKDYLKRDIDYLRAMIKPFFEWRSKVNSPLSITEFGATKQCFGYDWDNSPLEDQGGVEYARDLIRVFKENNTSLYNYWNYHGDHMGIYIINKYDYTEPVSKSIPLTKLINMFKTEL